MLLHVALNFFPFLFFLITLPASHAHYCLGDYAAARDAFQRGLDIDPTNANLKSGLQNAEARVGNTSASASSSSAASPPASSSERSAAGAGAGGGGLADLMAGLGGGARGAGGMPDLAAMMENPMMMQMAQQMMANGGLERLMSNPSVANMVRVRRCGVRLVTNRDCYYTTDESCSIRWWHALYAGTHGRPKFARPVSAELFACNNLYLF